MKNVVALSVSSAFLLKLIAVLLSDMNQVFAIYLNLLVLAYNALWNNYDLVTTSCGIPSLTSCNILNVLIYF